MRGKYGFVMIAFLILVAGSFTATAQTEYVRPPWDGVSRFTVLVMGIDRRPGEPQNLVYRPDAIMLMSFSPADGRIGVLSIPRDMHFALINGGELVPVNTLLVRGELQQEGTGPVYMMDTLQYNLGIYIDTYVIFDFQAFIALVDAIGGIDFYVAYPINDQQYPNMNYGYDPLKLSVGQHHFDGEMALKYARTRHNDDDYQRGQRQLEMFNAIREKALGLDTLPLLLYQAPTLLDQFSENVYTDIELDELLRLAYAVVDIPADHIFTGALGRDYSIGYGSESGKIIRIPDREKLAVLMVEVFGDNYSQ
jgi:LCP family protein required for cell wall assembly